MSAIEKKKQLCDYANEFRPRRNAPPPPLPPTCIPPPARPPRADGVIAVVSRTLGPSFDPNARSRTSIMPNVHPLRFHYIKGTHITFDTFRHKATRDQAEYSQGYVFTERPIKNNEKVMIQIEQVQRLYEGGLAFGVTCCDPTTIRPSELPEDSSDLVEMPEYWVGIKDIALQPKADSVLSFWITDAGEVKFEIDTNGARTVLHVDNSLELYMYFDVYGSTVSIKLLGIVNIPRSRSPVARDSREGSSRGDRNEQPMSIPKRPARIPDISSSLVTPPALPARPPPATHSPLRVNIRDSLEGSSSTPAMSTLHPTVDDLLGSFIPVTPPPIAPRTILASSASTSRLPPSRPTTSAAMMSPPAFSPPPLPSTVQSNEKDNAAVEPSAEGDECNICMDAAVNSVLYTCGHMCMCYECARRLLTSKGTCPICRAPVQDVIKTYKS